jgi:sulfide:quinone oxidoreductase
MGFRVVVLGAGFGGITAALELKRSAKELVDVTVIDREPDFYMGLTKLWVAAGRRTAMSCTRPRDRLTRHGVEFVQTEVHGIDIDGRSVDTSAGPVPFDKLIIALGLEVDPSVVPGLDEHALNLYSMSGAEEIAQRLPTVGGDVLITICATPFKCPPAPYEAAMMLDDSLRESGNAARIAVVTPEPRPMPILPPEAGERVIALLAERGIEFVAQKKIVGVDPGVAHFEDGSERRFDELIAVPPHLPAAFLGGVPDLTDASGLVVVDRETLATAVPGVFAVGDVAKALSFTDMPIPRAGILAEGEAKVVAANIGAELRDETPDARFDGRGYCFIETGGGKALRANGDFFAQPNPVADFPNGPSEQGFREKLAFEADRLEAWFGG